MKNKIFAISLITGMVLISATFAEEEEKKDNHSATLSIRVEKVSDEDKTAELFANDEVKDEEELFASCAGGKCPKEMIERLRAQKKAERENQQEDELAAEDHQEEVEEELYV